MNIYHKSKNLENERYFKFHKIYRIVPPQISLMSQFAEINL